jgi:glutamate formiminotransferase/formiminotetrahydrofolate cyclodeaminase
MGAIDVVPFIPISDITMEECVQLSKEFAREYASRFNVPVFLYEEAATRQDRRNLADVRKGEFEGLKVEIGKNPDRSPDFGPNHVHPTAGATAVGARQILIAYNINLATDNLAIAKQIAKQVRGKDGGLTAVKALGFELKDRGIVQVSMNMVDYRASQLFKVFELVKTIAEHHGVRVLESEIVGLVPMRALAETAEFYLQLQTFKMDQILETKLTESGGDRLASMNLTAFAHEVASEKPVPGGGSVAAYAGALAAALASMVSRLTMKKLASEKDRSRLEQSGTDAEAIRQRLISLVDEDSKSFASLMEAYRLPKTTEQEKEARSLQVQSGLKHAADIPLASAENCSQALSLARSISHIASENVLSDLETCIFLAHAGALGALANVEINLASIKDVEYRKETSSKTEEIRKRIEQDKADALKGLASRRKGQSLIS